jgi:hypothetical protein
MTCLLGAAGDMACDELRAAAEGAIKVLNMAARVSGVLMLERLCMIGAEETEPVHIRAARVSRLFLMLYCLLDEAEIVQMKAQRADQVESHLQ